MTRREFLKTLGLFVTLPFIGLRNEDRPAPPKTYADTVMSYGPIGFWPLDKKELFSGPRYILTTKENGTIARAIVESTWGVQ